MEHIELIHGTSTTHVERIVREGMPQGTSLTNDEGIAEYFAEEAVEASGGQPIWVYVRVPVDILQVDFPMLEEPILASAENLPFSCEADLHEHLEAVGWPSVDEWETSLEFGGAVSTKRAIAPHEILRVE